MSLITPSPFKEGKMTELKPIIGNVLFHFPQEWPAAYQIYEGDGHHVWLIDPHGDAVSVNKHKLLITLKRLFEEGIKND